MTFPWDYFTEIIVKTHTRQAHVFDYFVQAKTASQKNIYQSYVNMEDEKPTQDDLISDRNRTYEATLEKIWEHRDLIRSQTTQDSSPPSLAEVSNEQKNALDTISMDVEFEVCVNFFYNDLYFRFITFCEEIEYHHFHKTG